MTVADQSVRITNLDQASPARVAYDMANRIWVGENGNTNPKRKEFLDLFAECYHTVQGYRDFPGR